VASSLAGCVSLVANCANEYRVTTSRVCSFCTNRQAVLSLCTCSPTSLAYSDCLLYLPGNGAREAVLMALDPNRSLDSATAQTRLIAW
jgi:hypothetical protein